MARKLAPSPMATTLTSVCLLLLTLVILPTSHAWYCPPSGGHPCHPPNHPSKPPPNAPRPPYHGSPPKHNHHHHHNPPCTCPPCPPPYVPPTPPYVPPTPRPPPYVPPTPPYVPPTPRPPPYVPPTPPYVPPTPPYVPPTPPYVPPTPPYVPPPPAQTCPIDALKLNACVDVLSGLIHVVIGREARARCCPLLQGVADLDAALCLCTTIRARVLNINIMLPVALELLITCGKHPPPGFKCPPTY